MFGCIFFRTLAGCPWRDLPVRVRVLLHRLLAASPLVRSRVVGADPVLRCRRVPTPRQVAAWTAPAAARCPGAPHASSTRHSLVCRHRRRRLWLTVLIVISRSRDCIRFSSIRISAFRSLSKRRSAALLLSGPYCLSQQRLRQGVRVDLQYFTVGAVWPARARRRLSQTSAVRQTPAWLLGSPPPAAGACRARSAPSSGPSSRSFAPPAARRSDDRQHWRGHLEPRHRRSRRLVCLPGVDVQGPSARANPRQCPGRALSPGRHRSAVKDRERAAQTQVVTADLRQPASGIRSHDQLTSRRARRPAAGDRRRPARQHAAEGAHAHDDHLVGCRGSSGDRPGLVLARPRSVIDGSNGVRLAG